MADDLMDYLNQSYGQQPPQPALQPMPTPYQTGTQWQPGIMQDPRVLQALQQNLMQNLGGLSAAQSRAAQQRQYDDRPGRDFWDELSGRVLMPLTGAIDADRQRVKDASDFVLGELSKRRDARREEVTKQEDLLTTLSAVTRVSDPDDLKNVLEQKKEERLQQTADEAAAYKQTRLGQFRQKINNDMDYKNHTLELMRNRDQFAKEKWNKYAGQQERRIQLDIQRLQQQKDIAMLNHDDRMAALLDREIDQALDRQDNLVKMNLELEKFAYQTQRDSSMMVDGEQKYAGVKPQTAEQVRAKVAAPVAKQGGAAFDPAAVLGASKQTPAQLLELIKAERARRAK
jgi:hypothetical protein